MDWGLFFTIIGTAITSIGFMWQIMKHFEQKMESKMEKLDERIFWLATGKSLKEAILEEKMRQDKPRTNP